MKAFMEEKCVIDYTSLKKLSVTTKFPKQLSLKNLNVTVDILSNFVNRIPSWLTITVKHTLLKSYLIYKEEASWEWKQESYCDSISPERGCSEEAITKRKLMSAHQPLTWREKN